MDVLGRLRPSGRHAPKARKAAVPALGVGLGEQRTADGADRVRRRRRVCNAESAGQYHRCDSQGWMVWQVAQRCCSAHRKCTCRIALQRMLLLNLLRWHDCAGMSLCNAFFRTREHQFETQFS